MVTIPPAIVETAVLQKPVKQEYAFIVPKEGVYGTKFVPKNIESFDYVPNPEIDSTKIKGTTKVKNLFTGNILDDERYKAIGDMKVQVVDKLDSLGTFNKKNKTIKILKADGETMRNTVLHEVQHAVDGESGMSNISLKDALKELKKSHDLRKNEQTTETNEIFVDTEKMLKDNKTNEEAIKAMDSQIKTANNVKTEEAKKLMERLKMAKQLFKKYIEKNTKKTDQSSLSIA